MRKLIQWRVLKVFAWRAWLFLFWARMLMAFNFTAHTEVSKLNFLIFFAFVLLLRYNSPFSPCRLRFRIIRNQIWRFRKLLISIQLRFTFFNIFVDFISVNLHSESGVIINFQLNCFSMAFEFLDLFTKLIKDLEIKYLPDCHSFGRVELQSAL